MQNNNEAYKIAIVGAIVFFVTLIVFVVVSIKILDLYLPRQEEKIIHTYEIEKELHKIDSVYFVKRDSLANLSTPDKQKFLDSLFNR